MFTLAELEKVIQLVRASIPPTPQYAWPLLKLQTDVEVIVKHENHTPIGAFKVRGGIVYFDRLDEAKEQAIRIASERGLEYAPSFHRDFVIGVATYAHELFRAVD